MQFNCPYSPLPKGRHSHSSTMLSQSQPLHAVLFLLILCGGLVYGRLFSDQSDFVSDGSQKVDSHFIRLPVAEEACDRTYAIIPCTSSALGNLALIVVYICVMYLASKSLSAGSELMVEILGWRTVGRIIVPMIGAFPNTILILVSGLSGTTLTVQRRITMGVGLLAGSTIMLLTVIWGTCIIVGRCGRENSVAIDSQDTECFQLNGSGVSTDIWTSYAGAIIAISIIPLIIVQLPQVLLLYSGRHLVVLIALIVSSSLLILYCWYQLIQPLVQRRRLAYAKYKHVKLGILKHLKLLSAGRLCMEDGSPNMQALIKLFNKIDENFDCRLSPSELRALLMGIQFDEINLDEDDAVEEVIKDLDTSNNYMIEHIEFIEGVERWLEEVKRTSYHSSSMKHINDLYKQSKREIHLLGESGDQNVEGVENLEGTTTKTVLLLLLGTAIAAAFANPLLDAVDKFSHAVNFPGLFTSFIVLPLATNSKDALSAVISASRKNLRSSSKTFSKLYGAVTMNNLLCLSVLLALVYFRGLTWDFSSEALAVSIVCIVGGLFASFCNTYPVWTSVLAFLLYPFSLALIYVLHYVFGWS